MSCYVWKCSKVIMVCLYKFWVICQLVGNLMEVAKGESMNISYIHFYNWSTNAGWHFLCFLVAMATNFLRRPTSTTWQDETSVTISPHISSCSISQRRNKGRSFSVWLSLFPRWRSCCWLHSDIVMICRSAAFCRRSFSWHSTKSVRPRWVYIRCYLTCTETDLFFLTVDLPMSCSGYELYSYKWEHP